MITNIRTDVIHSGIDRFIPPMSVEEQWDISGLEQYLKTEFAQELPVASWLEEGHQSSRGDAARAYYRIGAIHL